MIAVALLAVIAATPDHSLTIPIPGTGPVRSVTLSSSTFHHFVAVKGPIAGAHLEVRLEPRGERLTLSEDYYSQASFTGSEEPYLSLKKGKLAMLPTPDGAAVAYSYDDSRTWRLMLLNPFLTSERITWPSASLAMATSPERFVERIFSSADPQATSALDWFTAHPSPVLARAVMGYLAAPGRTERLGDGRWAHPDADLLAVVLPSLRSAVKSDPKLERAVLDAVAAEGFVERGPSMLRHAAGRAPSFSARFEVPEGGSVAVLGRGDGGLTILQTQSLDGGPFELFGLAPGRSTLVFNARGYRSETHAFDVPDYGSVVTLRPAMKLQGELFQPDGGPLVQATVVVEEGALDSLKARASAVTDARGHFEISGWPGRQPVFFATPKGSERCYQWDVWGGREEPVRLTLPSKRQRFKVMHLSGSKQVPSPGLEVIAWPALAFDRVHAPCTERRTVSDAEGFVELETVIESPASQTKVRIGYPGARGQRDGGFVVTGAYDQLFPAENLYGAPCCK